MEIEERCIISVDSRVNRDATVEKYCGMNAEGNNYFNYKCTK